MDYAQYQEADNFIRGFSPNCDMQWELSSADVYTDSPLTLDMTEIQLWQEGYPVHGDVFIGTDSSGISDYTDNEVESDDRGNFWEFFGNQIEDATTAYMGMVDERSRNACVTQSDINLESYSNTSPDTDLANCDMAFGQFPPFSLNLLDVAYNCSSTFESPIASPELPINSEHSQSYSLQAGNIPEIASPNTSFGAAASTMIGSNEPEMKDDRQFHCRVPECEYAKEGKNRGFKSSGVLRRHENTVHRNILYNSILSSTAPVPIAFPPGARSYDCPVPGCTRKGEKAFSRKDNLTVHLRSFHDKRIDKRQRP